jgi:ectoine hydroxylase-related dioxygenase (phytanoyl-CoA dioxygenase family)
MSLTEEQIEHFYREGYVVAPGLVPQTSIQAVLDAAPSPREGNDGWQARALDFEAPDGDARIHRLLIEPGVVEAVESIFGAPARVYYGMLAIVPARGGNGLPWHQDNQYNQILGGALNVFIALSEITPEKAILWVAPRSHRLGVQPARDSDLYGKGHREAVSAPENGIPLPTLQPGDACIFDRNMLHRSLQNETDEDRYAYAAQYTSHNARYAETGKIPPLRMPASELRKRWQRDGLLM